MAATFIREPVSGRDLVSLKGELPVRFFAAHKFNELAPERDGTLLFLTLRFQGSLAGRAAALDELAAPNAGSRQGPAI